MDFPRLGWTALALCALAGTTLATPEPENGPEPIKGYRGGAMKSPTPPALEGAPLVPQIIFEVPHPADLNPPASTRGSGGAAAIFNDAMFPAGTAPVDATAFDLAYIAFGPFAGGNLDMQVTFYDTFDLDATQCAFFSNVLGTATIRNHPPFWGFVAWGKTDFPGNGPFNFHVFQDAMGNPAPIHFPDDTFGYEVRCLRTDNGQLWAGNPAASSVSQIVPMIRGPGVPPTIGSSGIGYWRNDPSLQGMPAYVDICHQSVNPNCRVAADRTPYLKLAANRPPPPPPTNVTDAGTLDCQGAGAGTDTVTVTLNAGAFQWVQFAVGGSGVNVPSSTYCDITTGVPPASFEIDTAIALYNSNGIKIASDDDGGDLLFSALTFGHGRRAATGDGREFDGSNGDLAAGTYYLAVGGFGTLFGGSSFFVIPTSSVESGDVVVTFQHNVSPTSNCPLPPPIAPTVALALGALPEGLTNASVDIDFGIVSWVTFDLPYDISPANAANFLDINNNGADATSDPEMALYDAMGNAVSANFHNDNSCNDGETLHAQLSFGNPGPRPGVGSCNATGTNGDTLPIGTYYLAVALSDSLSDAEFGTTGWQARTNSQSSVALAVTLRTPSGCRADFNGDSNVDPDDLSDFITCFFTNAAFPGACPEADFNMDGSADPDDLSDFITLFFTVTGGGPCA